VGRTFQPVEHLLFWGHPHSNNSSSSVGTTTKNPMMMMIMSKNQTSQNEDPLRFPLIMITLSTMTKVVVVVEVVLARLTIAVSPATTVLAVARSLNPFAAVAVAMTAASEVEVVVEVVAEGVVVALAFLDLEEEDVGVGVVEMILADEVWSHEVIMDPAAEEDVGMIEDQEEEAWAVWEGAEKKVVATAVTFDAPEAWGLREDAVTATESRSQMRAQADRHLYHHLKCLIFRIKMNFAVMGADLLEEVVVVVVEVEEEVVAVARSMMDRSMGAMIRSVTLDLVGQEMTIAPTFKKDCEKMMIDGKIGKTNV